MTENIFVKKFKHKVAQSCVTKSCLKLSRAFFHENYKTGTKKEPLKKLISLYILCEFSRFRRLQQRRIEVQKRHGEREKNWISAGIYLQLRVTLNLFLFFLSSPLYPKRQFIWKTVTEQRITELPNCFIPSSISLSHSLLLLHFIVVVVVEAACYCCVVKALKRTYTHTHAREKYIQKEMVEERERKSRITVGMMGTF